MDGHLTLPTFLGSATKCPEWWIPGRCPPVVAHQPVSQRYVLPSGAMPTRQCLIAHSCIACCLNLGNVGVKLILCVCWIVLGSLCFKGMEKYHHLNKWIPFGWCLGARIWQVLSYCDLKREMEVEQGFPENSSQSPPFPPTHHLVEVANFSLHMYQP